MPHHYPAEVFWSDDDEGFIAIARDLPGCSAFGETRLEALDELEHAISAWIQAAEAAGNPVPRPSVRQAEPRHSGKLLVRLPKTLHSKLVEEAEREEVSLNQYVVWRLSENACAHSFKAATAEIISTAVSLAFRNAAGQFRRAGSYTIGTGAVRHVDIARYDRVAAGAAVMPLQFPGVSVATEATHG